MLRDLKVSDIMSGASRVPYTSRGPWLQSQRECPDLVKVHEYLSNGTRPAQSKKGITDIRRYLGIVSLAKSDGLLVVEHTEHFKPRSQRIVIPCGLAEGLITAIHVELEHPT